MKTNREFFDSVMQKSALRKKQRLEKRKRRLSAASSLLLVCGIALSAVSFLPMLYSEKTRYGRDDEPYSTDSTADINSEAESNFVKDSQADNDGAPPTDTDDCKTGSAAETDAKPHPPESEITMDQDNQNHNKGEHNMKKKILVLILAVALSLLFASLITGCIAKNTGSAGLSSEAPENPDSGSQENAPLPAEYPPDFAFHFECWIGAANILDTYKGYIQKDLVAAGTAQAEFAISKEESEEIYAKLVEYDIASITREMTNDVLSTEDGLQYGVDPLTKYTLTFTANGNAYTVRGDATAQGFTKADPDAEHFCQMVQFLYDFLVNTEEFQSLPEAEGAYE